MNKEYAQKLEAKLRCLIAVLEVAIAKIERAIREPDADVKRLEKIKSNLTNTLDICHNAQKQLGERFPQVEQIKDVVDLEPLPSDLPSITTEDIASCDIHELSKQLGEL